jgi:tetratricopeptide (TPR) repeat protein
MTKRALLVGLAVALTLLAGIVARPLSAQPAPETSPSVPSETPPHARTEKSPPTAHGLPKAYRRGAALPKTAAEREKMLSDLYALLATAEDENSAKAVAEAIERVWQHSGSPTIDLLMERAMQAVAEEKLDLAIKLLDHVVALAPDFTEGWNRRAYAYFVKNDVDHALGDLRRALALDPNHFKALEGLAQIMREIGEKKAALKAYRQLLSVYPYWPGAQQAIDELERDVDGQGI